jgi:hypothetical protein
MLSACAVYRDPGNEYARLRSIYGRVFELERSLKATCHLAEDLTPFYLRTALQSPQRCECASRKSRNIGCIPSTHKVPK